MGNKPHKRLVHRNAFYPTQGNILITHNEDILINIMHQHLNPHPQDKAHLIRYKRIAFFMITIRFNKFDRISVAPKSSNGRKVDTS